MTSLPEQRRTNQETSTGVLFVAVCIGPPTSLSVTDENMVLEPLRLQQRTSFQPFGHQKLLARWTLAIQRQAEQPDFGHQLMTCTRSTFPRSTSSSSSSVVQISYNPRAKSLLTKAPTRTNIVVMTTVSHYHQHLQPDPCPTRKCFVSKHSRSKLKSGDQEYNDDTVIDWTVCIGVTRLVIWRASPSETDPVQPYITPPFSQVDEETASRAVSMSYPGRVGGNGNENELAKERKNAKRYHNHVSI